MSNRLFKVGVGVIALVLGLVAVPLYFSQQALEKEQQLAATGQFDEAMQKTRLAARLNPFSTEPLEARSELLVRQGRNGAAAEALKEAIEREPVSYEPYMLLGNVRLTGLNRPEEAAESYRKALERNPRNEEVTGRLAEALFRAGDLEAAAGSYERLRRRGEISAGGLYDLGRIYVHTGRPEKGLRTLRVAERRAGRGLKSSVELAIAEAYVVQRRYGEARRVLARSTSEQAPAILEFLNTTPQGYRQSVLENELYQ